VRESVLAHSGHQLLHRTCLLSGVKRTFSGKVNLIGSDNHDYRV